MQWFQPEESSYTPLPKWLPSGRVSSSPASSPSSPMVPAPPPPPGLDGIMTASWRLPSALFDSSLSVHSNNSSRHHISSFLGGGGADHAGNNSDRSRHPQPSTLVSMSSFLRSGLRPSSTSQELLTVPNPPPHPPPPPPPPQRETGGRGSLCGSVRSSACHDQEDPSSCLPPAAGSAFFNVVNSRSRSSSSMKREPQQPQTNLTTTAALVAGAPSQSVRPAGSDGGFGPLYDSTIAVTDPPAPLLPERNTAFSSPLPRRPPPTTEGSSSPSAKRLRGNNNNNNANKDKGSGSSSCSSNNPKHQGPNRTASANWVPLQPVSSSFSSGDASPPRVSPKQLGESLSLLQSFCRRPVTPPLIVVPSVPKHPPSAAASRAEGRSPIAAVTRQTVFVVPPLKGDPTLEAAVGSLARAPNSENQSHARPFGLMLGNSGMSFASTELRVNSRCSVTRPYVPPEAEEEAAIPSSFGTGGDVSPTTNFDSNHHHREGAHHTANGSSLESSSRGGEER